MGMYEDSLRDWSEPSEKVYLNRSEQLASQSYSTRVFAPEYQKKASIWKNMEEVFMNIPAKKLINNTPNERRNNPIPVVSSFGVQTWGQK